MRALPNGHLPEPGPPGTVSYSLCGVFITWQEAEKDLVSTPAADVCRECRLNRSGWTTTFHVRRSPIHADTWVPYYDDGGTEELFLHAGPLRLVKREVERRGGEGRWYHESVNSWTYERRAR
jgi:hypothetical protein